MSMHDASVFVCMCLPGQRQIGGMDRMWTLDWVEEHQGGYLTNFHLLLNPNDCTIHSYIDEGKNSV